jgi:cyclopropane fatty-acyl-phospholipid synthase-like methyltransferase
MSDWSQVFDADYLHFYEEYLTPERSDREAALIASLLGLESGLRVLDMPCGYGRILTGWRRSAAVCTGWT